MAHFAQRYNVNGYAKTAESWKWNTRNLPDIIYRSART
jgi:hypothetical protein